MTLGSAATLEDFDAPYTLLARLREHEPVSWVDVLGGWLVTRRDLAMEVMNDAETFTVDDPRFSTGRVVGPSMLTLDGAAHRRHRAPFAGPFRLDAVRERFSAVVAEETERLIDAIEPAGRAELRRSVAGPLAAAVVMHALELRGTDPEAVLGWYDGIVEAVDELTKGRPLGGRGRSSFAALRDALARVEAEPGLLAQAVEESLRLEPAAAVLDRYATRDAGFGGAEIRRGDLVRISVTAANRDPEAFPDPDRFDLDRPNAARHIAFARGPHVCIGMHLARLEAHAAVGRLLARLPRLRLDPEHAAEPRGLVFRKPGELRVLWG